MPIDPVTTYLERDGTRIAYQRVGDRPTHHVLSLFELVLHLDMVWTDPSVAAAMRDGARDGIGVVVMQQRGVGLSSPTARPPTVEEQAADVLAVLDAEGIREATLCGTASTCPAVALVAAQHPERVSGLVLYGGMVSAPKAGPPYAGLDDEQAAAYVEAYEGVQAQWGGGGWLPLWDPALATPVNLRLAAMLERCAASPEMARMVLEQWMSYDGRGIFPQVRVPTRVVGNPGYVPAPRSAFRALADVIPGAEYHETPPTVLGDGIGASWPTVIGHAIALARGSAVVEPSTDRVLASVLFIDIVGSTERLSQLGDAAWAGVLRELEVLVRRELAAVGGRHVNDTGDGALCELPGPAVAIRCAQALCEGARALGVELRAGVHTGECERRGENLSGMAVHIGARVCAQAGPGEVLVSRTVRDLMAGSEVAFASRGVHALKGVPGDWEIFAAGEEESSGAPLRAPRPTAADRVVVGLARRAPGPMRTAGRVVGAVQRRRMAARAS